MRLAVLQLTAPQPSEHCTRSSNPTNGCSFKEGFYCYIGAHLQPEVRVSGTELRYLSSNGQVSGISTNASVQTPHVSLAHRTVPRPYSQPLPHSTRSREECACALCVGKGGGERWKRMRDHGAGRCFPCRQGRGLQRKGWSLAAHSDPRPPRSGPPRTQTPTHMSRHVFLTGPPGDPEPAGLGGEVERLDLCPVSGLAWCIATRREGRPGGLGSTGYMSPRTGCHPGLAPLRPRCTL